MLYIVSAAKVESNCAAYLQRRKEFLKKYFFSKTCAKIRIFILKIGVCAIFLTRKPPFLSRNYDFCQKNIIFAPIKS